MDDTYAALALMYGYAARYAPSTVIEARINALVVFIPIIYIIFPFMINLMDNDMHMHLGPTRALHKKVFCSLLTL